METVTILRDLWERRLPVAGVALLAALAGIALMVRLPSLESRGYKVGVASARILVDTPNSQVVAVAPAGSDTLGTRAALISSLMADGVVKASIARRAGVPPAKLVGVANETQAAGKTPPNPPSGRDANVLTTSVPTTPNGDQLPIIEIDTQAPDVDRAAKLAAAAVAGLNDYLGKKSVVDPVRPANRLRVTGLGPPQARSASRGPGPLMALGASALIFVCGCVAIVIYLALARAWSAASEEQQPLADGSESGSDVALLNDEYGHHDPTEERQGDPRTGRRREASAAYAVSPAPPTPDR